MPHITLKETITLIALARRALGASTLRRILERLIRFDHDQDLSEIVPGCDDHIDATAIAQLACVDDLAVQLHAVDRAEHVVERAGGKHS